jgi:ubiquitin-like protein Pup
MAEQQHKSTRKSTEPDDQADTAPVDPSGSGTESKAKLDDDVDSILDEIDDVLEENAEEFVRSFVQKGGQ